MESIDKICQQCYSLNDPKIKDRLCLLISKLIRLFKFQNTGKHDKISTFYQNLTDAINMELRQQIEGGK